MAIRRQKLKMKQVTLLNASEGTVSGPQRDRKGKLELKNNFLRAQMAEDEDRQIRFRARRAEVM